MGLVVASEHILVAEVLLNILEVLMVWFSIWNAKIIIHSIKLATGESGLWVGLELTKTSPLVIRIETIIDVPLVDRSSRLKPTAN